MKNIILIIALVSFVGLESCSDRNPTPTYTLSSEFKDYFVNHDVGTKWIYEDTSSSVLDTIELISKEGEGWQEEGKNTESGEGYRLVFTSRKHRNFKLNVSINKNGQFAQMNLEPFPNGAHAGTITWAYRLSENKWFDEFSDSLVFKDQTYYDVILSYANTSDYYHCYYSKLGLVAFKEFALKKVIKL